jgi:imidazolonepropionase-like amidohydrolase
MTQLIMRSSIIRSSMIIAAVVAWAASRPAAQAPAAASVTALTNARVIDGTGRAPTEGATILVRGGRVDSVGAASAVTIPDGAERVDMSGKTILPGFVNAHGHVQKGFNNSTPVSIREDLIRRLKMYANYGVTTVVNLGANPDDELEGIRLRDEQDSLPVLDRARMYTSGGSVRRWKTAEEARKDVDRLADLKVDVVKFHFDDPPNKMAPEVWGAIVEQAQKRGLRVTPHIFYLADARAAVEKGVNALGHSVRDVDVDAAFVDAMRKRNVGYIPTLTREVSVYAYETTPAFFQDPFFQRGMSLYRDHYNIVTQPAYQEKLKNDPAAQAIKKALVQAQRNLKILSDAGVRIAMGTDSGVPNNATFGRWEGYFEHVELELMVEAGMTPMQALVAATGAAALVSNRNNVGTITRGNAADFLVLDANPLQDIKNTRQINSVWIAGRRLPAPGTN